MSDGSLYIFLDEGGNLTFSPKGSRFFTITSVTKERPFEAYKELIDLKYNLAEQGLYLEEFHASEDNKEVRPKVFDVIQNNLSGTRIDSVVVEKCKTGTGLQEMVEFYSRMIGYLLKFVLQKESIKSDRQVLIYTDSLPVRSKRAAFEKAIKTVLAQELPSGTKYTLNHHDSKSNLDLQIADYCNWAIYKKWNDGSDWAYRKIAKSVRSEFDIFRNGTRKYY